MTDEQFIKAKAHLTTAKEFHRQSWGLYSSSISELDYQEAEQIATNFTDDSFRPLIWLYKSIATEEQKAELKALNLLWRE